MRALVLLVVVGCGNGNCVDGVCPDVDHATHEIGPCQSAFSAPGFAEHCTYRYGAVGVTDVDCPWHETGEDAEHGSDTVRWTYDAAGQPLSIDSEHEDFDDGVGSHGEIWSFANAPIEVRASVPFGPSTVSRTYDPALFAFLPLVGSTVLAPRAELGLLTDGATTFTWTMSGTTWTRARSTGGADTFELDDRGRILTSSIAGTVTTYTFDGDLLLSRTTGDVADTFEYDRGGNLAVWTATENTRNVAEVYSYGCF
jgi:YD repeat-containing protein